MTCGLSLEAWYHWPVLRVHENLPLEANGVALFGRCRLVLTKDGASMSCTMQSVHEESHRFV